MRTTLGLQRKNQDVQMQFFFANFFSLFQLHVLTPLRVSRSYAWWAAATLVKRGFLFTGDSGGFAFPLRFWWTGALSGGPVANSRLASPPLPYSLLGGEGMAAFLSFVSWVSFLKTCTLHPPPTLWGGDWTLRSGTNSLLLKFDFKTFLVSGFCERPGVE